MEAIDYVANSLWWIIAINAIVLVFFIFFAVKEIKGRRKRGKKDLREVCREKYGDDFVEMYDMVNAGVPIGNLEETKIFLAMVEAAKEEC